MSNAEEHSIEDRIVMGLVLRGLESIIRESLIMVGPRAVMIALPESISLPLPEGCPEISGEDAEYIRQAWRETKQEIATGMRDTIREMEDLPEDRIHFMSRAQQEREAAAVHQAAQEFRAGLTAEDGS